MFSFINRKNADATVFKFLKYSGISIDPDSVIAELDKHPDYPSLLAISDVLTNFDIENSAFRMGPEELYTLPYPFIVHSRTDGSSFMIVHDIGPDKAVISTEKWEKHKITTEQFKKQYGGVVLVAAAPENAASPGTVSSFLNSLRAPAIVAAATLILLELIIFNSGLISHLAWQPILVTLAKSAGLVTAILLLVQSIDKNNPLIQVLCTAGGKKADCNAILSSKAASAFWGYSWSEIGFFYFAGTWLVALFGGSSLLTWRTLLLLNLLSLPYTFYSIWHQARVAKQWCVLCCVVQALLWVEFMPLLSINLPLTTGLDITLKSASAILACLLSPVILWAVLKPIFLKTQQLQPLKDQLRKFKYNTELFNLMLNDQPRYAVPDESWSIVLGNVEANSIITMVTNPYCPPCAKTHKLLDDLLDQNENIQARIVFTANNSDDDIKTPVSRHMMALAELPDKRIVKKAMHDWYEEKQKNYEAWAKIYPVQLNEANFYKIDKQKAWCTTAEIKGTPTLLLNGHILPQAYQLPDLKYMLE
ncbi:MAG: vitamin K epoxide reductase family protein [Mucilaginibacter sp.]